MMVPFFYTPFTGILYEEDTRTKLRLHHRKISII